MGGIFSSENGILDRHYTVVIGEYNLFQGIAIKTVGLKPH